MDWWKEGTTPESSSISVGAVSDPGRVRDDNEDAYGHFSKEDNGSHLFIVADGMGGHARGREASTTTVDVIQKTYFDHSASDVLEGLQKAFQRANEEVHRKANSEEGDTVGTTATALVLQAGRAFAAHVGDSRLYRFGESGSQLLTVDHTIVGALRREGTLTAEEAQTHPRRGTLTRAIGVEPTVEIDALELEPLRRGDRFLLCSDGLQDLSLPIFQDVVLGHPPQAACEQLVQRANERGGYDNATALVVHVT